MKSHTIILLLFILIVLSTNAQDAVVQLTIKEGVSGQIKTTIEKNSSLLLAQINNSFAQKRSDLDLTGIPITDKAKKSLSNLWENIHFHCDDSKLVENCLHTSRGYQIRQIPLIIKQKKGKKVDDIYQEAVISFNSSGVITSFYFAIGINDYYSIIKKKKEDTDLRCRMQILDYIEQFRTAYSQKDVEFVDIMVFSSDALIVTETVMKIYQKSRRYDHIIYRYRTIVEDITKPIHSFVNSKYRNVKFDEIEVLSHPTNKSFYGVTLHISYTSSTYSDDGYMFLLWDFRDEENPQIHVRTWQPKYTDSSKSFIATSKEDVFSFSDFDIGL